jgi:NADH dehydrogenase
MRSAVTGAFSYSGKYIAQKLLAKGDEVITLTGHAERAHLFEGRIKAFPFNFDRPQNQVESLRGVDVLYNTYWVRFDKGSTTQPGAVESVKTLIKSAVAAGVKRIVHISITNPSLQSHLPYFRGKAEMEQAVLESGMSNAILRPTVLFGREDVLVNNMAWLLRRFPFMPVMGQGEYRLQPVYVDDLATLAVEWGDRSDNVVMDAVGPEIFSFADLLRKIAETVGKPARLVPMNPSLALGLSQIISLFTRDVILTRHEVEGLMADLLVSSQPPTCPTQLSDWLYENRNTVGVEYASELKKHFD